MAIAFTQDLTASWTDVPTQPTVEREAFTKLQQREYIIIKYPQGRRFWQLPRELRFRLDEKALLIVWKGVLTLKTLSIHRIVAVQRGPFTDAFRQFPFPKAEDRSFSIFYLDEKQKGKYAGLKSLDLTCETSEECNEWIEGLNSLGVYAANHAKRDPIVIWLHQLWCSHARVKITEPQLTYRMSRKAALAVTKSFSSNSVTTQRIRRQQSEQPGTQTLVRFREYISLFNALFEKGRLYEMFKQFEARQRAPMSLRTLEDFLSQECEWGGCGEGDRSTTQRGRAGPSSDVTFAQFLSILRHEVNIAVDPRHTDRVWQDMTRPLPHYFINSSHNTYLEGDQVKDRSACEAYTYALLQGCRCVEIDCWNDAFKLGGEDISIHHGFTFTSKLAFTDVIETLTEYSFHSSEYPVIISIENHCNTQNQLKMAEVFKSKQELCEDNVLPNGRLPPPEQLKRKIVLKGTYAEGNSSSRRVSSSRETYTEDEGDSIEDSDLKSLINYCRISRQPLTHWEEVSVREIFNVSKGVISQHCHRDQRDPWMVSCTEKNLVRVYPPGTNTNSANYDPTLFWSYGAQIVSLNFQKPDLWMQLNQGFFRQNGGCGYVLKPQVMRDLHQGGYDPNTTNPIEGVDTVQLRIELISGQQLCPYWRKCRSLSVEISTYGIPADTDSMETTAVSQEPFWPQWEESEHVYQKTILMPDLCLVYFNVTNRFRLKTTQYAQNCIPLVSLRSGLRYVTLRTPGGTLIPESGLFVKVTKTGGVDLASPVSEPHSMRLNSWSSNVTNKDALGPNLVPLSKTNGSRRSNGSQRHSIKLDLESSFSTSYVKHTDS